MFRQQLLLPFACLTIVLGVGAVVLVAPAPALAQDRATEERLDRLERDLNMLQRQVYQGGPPPAIGGDNTAGGGGSAVDLEVRMERIEQQMRELTGRIEEVGNRVEQLRQRIEQVNSDVAMRLGEAPGSQPPPPDVGTGPAPSAAAGLPPSPSPGVPPYPTGPPPPPPDAADQLTPPGMSRPPPAGADTGTADAPGDASGGPTPIFGTLTPPGSAPPPGQASAAPTRAPAAAAGPPSGAGSPAEQFNYAYGLLKQADYPAAEAALKAFVARYPKDRLAGSAQYWLGETYYTRGRYIDAASAFAEGYRRYPRGPKAADDLLKLGMSLARADQKRNACLALDQLDHDFPHPGAAVKDRAAAERRRLGC